MSALEITKKFREVQRQSVKELIDKVNQLFQQQHEHSEDDEIKVLEEVIDKKYRTVAVLDYKVYDLMLFDSGVSEKNLENEFMDVYQYATDYFVLKYIISLYIEDSDSSLDEHERSTLPFKTSKDLNLSPLIKLEKVLSNSERFSLLCLSEGIHNRRNMDCSENLQNLTMVIKIVKDYFQSCPNNVVMCPEVVNAFESKFGREDLLTEFCIRELLDIILKSKTSIKLSLLTLYNQLHCCLRSLHTLGITSERYAPILFPLVSSCIPEETLKMWKSSGMSLVGKGYSERSCKDNLDKLMLFLKTLVEVESTDQVLAAASLAINETNPVKSRCKKVDEISIAAESHVSAVNNNNGKATKHRNFSSFKRERKQYLLEQYKSFEDQRKIVESKEVCTCCLKRGHSEYYCRSKPQCKQCNKPH